MLRIRLLVSLFVLSVTACGGENDGLVADRADIPETPDGAQAFLLEDTVIPAGHEAIFCYFLDPLEKDIYIRGFVDYQGKFGHHVALFKALVREEPGSKIDCTSSDAMAKMVPVVASEQFGLSEMPEGMAIRVAAGSQLVIQQHIVNTSNKPIIVADGAHMFTTDPVDEQQRIGFIGLSDVTFDIPVGEKAELTFDCEVPWDMNIFVLGPHMHEFGRSISTEVMVDGTMRRVVDVPSWEASYRDEPPVTQFELTEPLALKAGDIIRTTCNFENTSDDSLEFPAEMCATFGYFFPALAEKESFVCSGL